MEREKRLERADIVNARLETRVERSAGKLKIVKERKKEWEKLNGKLDGKVVGVPNLKEGDEDMWEDVAEGDENRGGTGAKEAHTGVVRPGEMLQLPVLPHQPPAEVPLPTAEEDEVL